MGEYRDPCELRNLGSGMWRSEFGERMFHRGYDGAQVASVARPDLCGLHERQPHKRYLRWEKIANQPLSRIRTKPMV